MTTGKLIPPSGTGQKNHKEETKKKPNHYYYNYYYYIRLLSNLLGFPGLGQFPKSPPKNR